MMLFVNESSSGLVPLMEHYKMERKMMGWSTPADYMNHVHPHWRSFEAPNPFLHYMLGVIYIGFMFSALTGNGVVIWVFSSCKSLQTPSNMFVINLAVLDFMMMLKTPIFIVNSFNEGPVWGKLGCDIFALIGSYAGYTGAMTNAAIAYDRYRTIVRPFDGKMTRGKALLMCLGTWLWATPFCLLPLFEVWSRYVPEGFLTTCTADFMTEDTPTRAFVAFLFVYSYIIPLFLLIFYYSKIVTHVSQHEQTLRDQAKRMNVESLRTGSREQNEKSVEVRIAKVAIGLSLMFLLAWTPYAVVALIAAFGDRSVLTPLVSMLPALFAKSVACVDPWIYAINHPRYRMELQKKLPWFCIHEPETPNEDTQSGTTEKSAVTT